jgi:hypothetical protein
MTGSPWSWWRRHAAELGIELIRVGTKSFARAADVLAALERLRPATQVVEAEVDELAEFRRQIAEAG